MPLFQYKKKKKNLIILLKKSTYSKGSHYSIIPPHKMALFHYSNKKSVILISLFPFTFTHTPTPPEYREKLCPEVLETDIQDRGSSISQDRPTLAGE